MNSNGENGRFLPDGWEWKTVSEVTLPIKKVDPAQEPDKEFTYLDIASIDNSVHKITEPKSYDGVDAPSRARQMVRTNDVLFSTVRTYLEKIAQVPEIYDGQIASTGFAVLRANEMVLPKYLFYYSLTQNFLEPLNELQRGTSYPAVRDSDVRTQLIPLAPLPEQERIVSRIEELFSDLEAGVAGLERVRVGLERYGASILKAAVDGKLIERNPQDESAEKLLSRFGKEPLNGVDLSVLPESWCWTKPNDLAIDENSAIGAGPFGTIFKAHDFKPTGVPIIFLRHILPGKYFPDKRPTFMDQTKWDELFRSYSVYGGELLVTKLGEPPGVCAIYPFGIGPAMVTPDVIRMSVNEELALPKYLMYFFNSENARKFAFGVAFGTTRLRMTLPIFRNIPVPLPPLDEQQRIVAEVERRLSVVGEVESAVEVGLVRAGRLRQSVLRSAFEGRLV